MKNTCFYCKKQFSVDDLRPYGPNKSMVCYKCGADPRYLSAIETNMGQAFDVVKAEAEKRLAAGENVAIRIDETRGYIVVPVSDVTSADVVEFITLGPREPSN